MAMMDQNIFLDIIERKIPADIVYEDDDTLAFRDIHPQAPTHILVIPKKEIRTHRDLQEEDFDLMGKLHKAAFTIAKQQGLEHYRLVINCGEQVGQSVPHIHMHLLGGRGMGWPPG